MFLTWEGKLEENSQNAGGLVCFAELETLSNFVLISSWKKQKFLCDLHVEAFFLICLYTLSSSFFQGLFGDV